MKSISTSSPPATFLYREFKTNFSCASKFVTVAKKSSKSPKNPSPKGAEPAAPRITSNVKQSLQFVKFFKNKSDTAKPSTRYRRKRVEKEETPVDTETYQDPTLTVQPTNQGLKVGKAVLLVDGYNVCGYWPKLKKYFMDGRLFIARQKLIDELRAFSARREMKVVVVFDTMLSGPNRKEEFMGIDVVYAADADAWIEKEVDALRNDGCPEVWVATSDRAHQDASQAGGAFIWSSKALVSEINAEKREVQEMLRSHQSKQMRGSLLKFNLDPKVVGALKDLRAKLSQNPSTSL